MDDPPALTERILQKLPDQRKEIDLSHVQVFLSELWDRSLEKKTNGALPRLELDLIQKKDNLEGVLDSFLKKQFQELSDEYGENFPLELLAVMISERFTKLQLSSVGMMEILDQRGITYEKEKIPSLLKELERRRILRKLKSGDQTRYEISHDTLALVVGQNLTEEMRLRQKAKDIYTVYEERKGFFSQEDLDLLRPYKQYLDLSRRIGEARIAESEAVPYANRKPKNCK